VCMVYVMHVLCTSLPLALSIEGLQGLRVAGPPWSLRILGMLHTV